MAQDIFIAEFDDREIKDFMARVQAKVKNIKGGSSVLQDIVHATVFADVIDHFEKQEGSEGPWAQRSEPYRSLIEGQGYSNILQVTGRLRGGLVKGRATSEFIEWINPVEYAAAHDVGGKLPKRDFMWLSEAAMEKISELTLAFILEGT